MPAPGEVLNGAYDSANGALRVSSSGGVAHDAADTGSPVKIGGKASTALPAAVANGDRVNAYFDEYGRLVVNLGTTLSRQADSVTAYTKGVTKTKVSADGVISATSIAFFGYYVEASSSGVISFYDNASAASGDSMLALSRSVTALDYSVLPTPIIMNNGLYFDLVSGTATVYVFTRELGV